MKLRSAQSREKISEEMSATGLAIEKIEAISEGQLSSKEASNATNWTWLSRILMKTVITDFYLREDAIVVLTKATKRHTSSISKNITRSVFCQTAGHS